MHKPELLISAGSCEEIAALAMAGADAVQIGDNEFGLRMPGSFYHQDLRQAIQVAHEHDIKAYVSVHNLMSHEHVERLPDYLKNLEKWDADGIFFGDPAVYMIVKEHGLDLPLHWNVEMTATNYSSIEYWARKGIRRAVIARELNLQEVAEIVERTSVDIQVQIHGMTNIYHSKRHLVQSYMGHLEEQASKAESYDKDQGLYLVEHERRNLKLPIFEDKHGTHIMSPDDLCTIDTLDELLISGPQSLYIEGLLKSIDYNCTVVKSYRQAIDRWVQNPNNYKFDVAWLEQIEALQPEGRELDYGFFFKEQVY